MYSLHLSIRRQLQDFYLCLSSILISTSVFETSTTSKLAFVNNYGDLSAPVYVQHRLRRIYHRFTSDIMDRCYKCNSDFMCPKLEYILIYETNSSLSPLFNADVIFRHCSTRNVIRFSHISHAFVGSPSIGFSPNEVDN